MVHCPRCQLVLKAHGHPGIPLHRALDGEPLCATCRYHADDSCNFPQRPQAQTCTLYRPPIQETEEHRFPPRRGFLGQRWRQYQGLGAVLALLLISLVVVLLQG
ncbi:hypothetical protein GFS31_17550 [Leptolyngbya sp. BL0902]|nr:hypothetical protein GFS31_17550 [Leptolyngbya sp. BL0902]